MEESSELLPERAPEASVELTTEEFCELLRTIETDLGLRQIRRQESRDAVEGLGDRLVDRYLARNLPASPRSWSHKVLAHLLLRRSNSWIRLVGQRFEGEECSEGRETRRLSIPLETLAAWRNALERMSAELDRLLTSVEREVLAAVKKSSSLAEIARDCQMTARDARTRLRRIAAKARKLARSRPPPPSLL